MKRVVFLTNICIKQKSCQTFLEVILVTGLLIHMTGKIFESRIAYVTLHGPADRVCRIHHFVTQKWSRARTWPQRIFDRGPVSCFLPGLFYLAV